ncbi:coiled-coil domain-containing protein 34-like [Ptychodera flava]|uniref:coiled-coil domain-containing protein 34-like n=1 Tax=Ptychodera flava TaxID=63121 RepID=UPI00396A2244
MKMDEQLDGRPHSTPSPSKTKRRSSERRPRGKSAETEERKSPRSYSLDSTGESTKSLLSVLSHSSVESISSGSLTDDEADKASDRTFDNDEKSEGTGSTHDELLSPWQLWLIRKEKEERIRIRKQLREEERKRQEEEEKKKAKEELLARADEKFREWSEEKDVQQRIRSRNQMRKEKLKKQLKEEEKCKIEEKSKEKFEEWINKKKEQEKERKQKEKEEEARKEQEKEEKKKKAEGKYKEWKEKAASRPKPQKSSFGYTGGTLTGYYDSAAYPIPNYYNPVPWQPIAVPKTKPAKVKKGRKKKDEPVIVSPPMLFKARSQKENLTIWGRPR